MPDILIRGMEMPKDSPVYLTVCPSGGVYVHTYERGYGALVKSQYRVIELPEHGDLIDIRNAENAMFALGNYHLSDYKQGWNDGIKAVIENAPVIVPSNKEDTK